MFFWDNSFLYSFLLVGAVIYLVLYSLFKCTSFTQALILTIIGMVFFSFTAGMASTMPFLFTIIIAALIIQQVYKGSITESVALAIVAILAGSFLIPLLGA